MAKTICPVCQREVDESHFVCAAGARGGLAGGEVKRRGDTDFYKKLSRKAAMARRRAAKLRKQGG